MRPHRYRTGKTGRPVEGTPCKRCGHSKSDHTVMHHVVMYSGGIGSFCAAERVKAKAGPFDTITLLFTDTKMEDEDLYRFLDETEKALGIPITNIADGRTPWEVFRDVKYLGNSRIDPCSKILKRELAVDWLKANKDPKNTICYLGIDWSEEHRYLRAKARHAELGWRYEAPMCEAPYLTKKEMLDRLSSYEIKPPRLYEMGFPHNNCGGFCVKAGKAHFKLLLEQLPERYKYHEEQENNLRKLLNKDVTILREQKDGQQRRLPLAILRQRIEGGDQIDKFDWGGCGCFLDVEDKQEAVGQ